MHHGLQSHKVNHVHLISRMPRDAAQQPVTFGRCACKPAAATSRGPNLISPLRKKRGDGVVQSVDDQQQHRAVAAPEIEQRGFLATEAATTGISRGAEN